MRIKYSRGPIVSYSYCILYPLRHWVSDVMTILRSDKWRIMSGHVRENYGIALHVKTRWLARYVMIGL
jgi:hypothetical protein